MTKWNTRIDEFLTNSNNGSVKSYTDSIRKLNNFVKNELPLMNGGMQKQENDQKNIQKGGEIKLNFSEFNKKIDNLSNSEENYISRITKLESFVDDELNELLRNFLTSKVSKDVVSSMMEESLSGVREQITERKPEKRQPLQYKQLNVEWLHEKI